MPIVEPRNVAADCLSPPSSQRNSNNHLDNSRPSNLADNIARRLSNSKEDNVSNAAIIDQTSPGGSHVEISSPSAIIYGSQRHLSLGPKITQHRYGTQILPTTQASRRHNTADRRLVTESKEAEVFNFYIVDAGPWLDIVSSARHFGHSVPRLALKEPVLYYACLAYASHVMTLQGRLTPEDEAEYHNKAFSLLIPLLTSRPVPSEDAALLATSVILRMSEQFAELAEDAQHHLNGAFSLFVSYCRFALLIIACYTVGRYFRDRKQLRRFPLVSISGFTPLWIMYHWWRGKRFAAVDKAHNDLGSVVRIAPNHVSFSDPSAYKDIYDHGSPILKDDFYAHIAAGNPSMAQTTSKADHARKRKNLTHVFSTKEITAMEPRVMRIVQKLCRDIKIKSEGGMTASTDAYPVREGMFELRPWLNMFSYDAITAMFWSNSYGFLDKGNDLWPSYDSSGNIKQVHAMDTFHSAAGFNVLFAHLPAAWYKIGRTLLKYTHGQQAGELFYSMAQYQVNERLKASPPDSDLFSCLPYLPTEKRPIPMPVH
ncbi:MAG: hypothetical protein Q9221_002521 [Calogaya cf. arnoldii]